MSILLALQTTAIVDSDSVALSEAASIAVLATTPESAALAEVSSITVVETIPDALVFAEAFLGDTKSSATELMVAGDTHSLDAALVTSENVALTESENASQQSTGQITDSDVFMLDEVVIEPVPPIPAVAPPIFGGGLGRKRIVEQPQRRLQRRPVARDYITLDELAVAELHESFVQEFSPWQPESDDDDALLVLAVLAE